MSRQGGVVVVQAWAAGSAGDGAVMLRVTGQGGQGGGQWVCLARGVESRRVWAARAGRCLSLWRVRSGRGAQQGGGDVVGRDSDRHG